MANEKKIGPSALCEQYTQNLYWQFTRVQLKDIRRETNQRARARLKESWRQEWLIQGVPEPKEFRLLDMEEEFSFCQFFEKQALLSCRRLGFPTNVLATAVTFMKRFFLRNTVMDYTPKSIMLTCLYLASKTEGSFLPLAEFAEILAVPSAESISSLEMVVSEALRFHYSIRHPYRSLYGFYLDFQRTISDMELLSKCYEKALAWLEVSLFTDVCLIYQPSQIALAVWHHAAREVGMEIESYITSIIINEANGDAGAMLLRILDEIEQELVDYQPQDSGKMKSINSILVECRNPATNPSSALYRKQQIDRDARDESQASPLLSSQ